MTLTDLCIAASFVYDWFQRLSVVFVIGCTLRGLAAIRQPQKEFENEWYRQW